MDEPTTRKVAYADSQLPVKSDYIFDADLTIPFTFPWKEQHLTNKQVNIGGSKQDTTS